MRAVVRLLEHELEYPVLVQGTGWRVIRTRETHEDLIRGEQI